MSIKNWFGSFHGTESPEEYNKRLEERTKKAEVLADLLEQRAEISKRLVDAEARCKKAEREVSGQRYSLTKVVLFGVVVLVVFILMLWSCVEC